MAIAIQDLPSVVAGSSSSASDLVPQAAIVADFSNTVPSTIVTLGGALPEALTFNAAGLLDAARVDTTRNTALSLNVTPPVATTTTDTTAATAVAENSAAPTTAPTTAPIAITSATTNSNQEPAENWRNANAYLQQAGGMATPRPHIVEVA